MRSKLMQSGLFDGRHFTNQSRVILVLTGYAKDDVSGNYLNFLKEKAHKENVTLFHIEDLISHSRSIQENQKMYSFWDAYAVADLVTYPSLWEGWGNQLLEAFQARLPVILFEYPVYLEDIKQRGFDVISLGSKIDDFDEANLARINQETLINAANDAVRILTDREHRLEMVKHNHFISQKHYSLTALQTMLKELLET